MFVTARGLVVAAMHVSRHHGQYLRDKLFSNTIGYALQYVHTSYHAKSLNMPIHLEIALEPQLTIYLCIRIEHIGIGEYRKLLFACTYIAEFSYIKL